MEKTELDYRRQCHPMIGCIDTIIAYENGELTEEETIELFQRLIDTGLAWSLQGSYGRMAQRLIESGYCTLPGKDMSV